MATPRSAKLHRRSVYVVVMQRGSRSETFWLRCATTQAGTNDETGFGDSKDIGPEPLRIATGMATLQ